MRRFFMLFLTFVTLIVISGCGGGQAARSSAPATGSSVAQIMENAAKAEEQSAENTAAEPSDAVTEIPSGTSTVEEQDSEIDVDLTKMSSTMIYAEVSNMMYEPDLYVGKTVRMQGQSFSLYYDETDSVYYSVIISDATACCAQGLEYELIDGSYPEDDQEVTVTGVFELYEELGMTYCRLANATMSI